MNTSEVLLYCTECGIATLFNHPARWSEVFAEHFGLYHLEEKIYHHLQMHGEETTIDYLKGTYRCSRHEKLST